MINVKLKYKKALRQAIKEKMQMNKRFTATCRRELERGGKRFQKSLAKQTKKVTGIKLNQTEIKEKYLRARFRNSKDVNK